jgi:hypothetical protein
MKEALQEVLEAEMSQFIGAGPSERTEERRAIGQATTPGTSWPDRQAGTAGAAGSEWWVLDGAVRTLRPQREGAGGGAGGDVRARRVDPQGQGDHRGALRPHVLCERYFANRDLAAWVTKWQGRYPKLVDWVEIGHRRDAEHLSGVGCRYRLPRAHHKHLKSTNMLEWLNEEIRRRTWVVWIFPNSESCPPLIRALCVETHEGWLEDSRYLNMSLLTEHKQSTRRRSWRAGPDGRAAATATGYVGPFTVAAASEDQSNTWNCTTWRTTENTAIPLVFAADRCSVFVD